MYVCMYVCMYVHTYVRMYVRTYICMYVCMLNKNTQVVKKSEANKKQPYPCAIRNYKKAKRQSQSYL